MAILRVRKGLEPGAVFPVFASRSPTTIGREGQVDVALGDAKASRRHASIGLVECAWLIKDLQSSNGTIVQGKRVETAAIQEGASIQIGGTLLSFHEHELIAPPAHEIHGARPIETLREEAGVFVFRAHQAAMDREVRCDWLHPSRQASPELLAMIEQAIEEAHKLSDPSIVPVVHAQAVSEGTFVVLRGPVRPTLGEKMDEVLNLPLATRIEVFRALVDLTLERATWEALRFPIAPCHVDIEMASSNANAGASPAVFLPAIDLGALLAARTGSLLHLAHHAPYLPPELQDAADGAASAGTPALASTLYNLGALGYHLLTRQKPMGEGDAKTVLENHRTLQPAPASLLDAGIPAKLSTLLQKMLEKDARNRPMGRQEVLASFPSPPPRTVPTQKPAAAALPRSQPAKPAQPTKPRPVPSKPVASKPSETPRAAAEAPAREAQRKSAAPSAKKPGAPSFLYLPLWGLAWVALFFAARYVSKIVFQSLSG